jgi:hypothetical protein
MSRHLTCGASAAALSLAALLLTAPARAADVDKLLPDDTETVVQLNVKQILTSPLGKKLPVDKLRDALQSQDEASQVLTDLGFDPFRDVDSITVAFSGGKEPDRGLLIVRGKFDTAKFKAKAEEVARDMGDVVKIHKVPNGPGGESLLYEVNAPGQPDTIFVALAGDRLLLASAGKDYVLDALDKEAGKRTTSLKNKALQTLLARTDQKQSFWMTLQPNTLAKSPLHDTLPNLKETLDKVEAATLGVNLDRDVKFRFAVVAKTTADAQDLHGKIKQGLNAGLASLLLFSDESTEPLVDFLKTIKPKIKEKVVSIEFVVAGDLIEKALDQKK